MIDWHDLSPTEVLDRYEVLDFEQVAYVLALTYSRGATRGQLNPKAVADLVAAGKLRLLDPDQTRGHRRVASAVVRHYRDTGRPLPTGPLHLVDGAA